jgi:hypothetical protein
MARVPVTPQIENRAMPVPTFDPGNVAAATGAQLGNALTDFGQATTRIFEKEYERQQSVVVQDFVNRATDYENELLNDGFTQKGKNAFGVTEKNVATFDKMVAQDAQEIRDERAKFAYKSAMAGMRDRIHDSLQRHEMGQIEAQETATTKAALEKTVSNAKLNYTQSDAIQSYQAQGERALKSSAINNGWDLEGEVYEGALRAYRTDLHGGVIDAHLAAGQGVAAMSYLEAHKSEMDGGEVNEITKKTKPMADDQRVNLEADKLWAEAKGDYEKALAGIKPDDPLRTQLEIELGQRRQQKLQVEADEAHAAYDAFYPLWIEANRSYRRVPPHIWNALKPKQQEEVRRDEEQDANRARVLASGNAAERAAAKAEAEAISKGKMSDLLDQMVNEPAAFLAAASDPATYDGLTTADQTRVRNKKRTLIQNLQKAEGAELSPAYLKVMVGKAKTAGLISGAKKSVDLQMQALTPAGRAERDKNEKWGLFLESFDNYVDGFLEKNGRPPNEEEAGDAADRLLIKSVHDVAWLQDFFGADKPSTKYLFEGFTPEEAVNVEGVVVPDADRKAIEFNLRKEGLEVTDAAIRYFYLQP